MASSRIDIWDVGNTSVELECGFPRGMEQRYDLLGKEIGKGGFGAVRVAVERSSGKEWACKSIAKSLPSVPPGRQRQHLDNIKREAAILRKLRGTLNVVFLQEVFEDDTHVHLVMELCRGGELLHSIGSKHYSEKTVGGFRATGWEAGIKGAGFRALAARLCCRPGRPCPAGQPQPAASQRCCSPPDQHSPSSPQCAHPQLRPVSVPPALSASLALTARPTCPGY